MSKLFTLGVILSAKDMLSPVLGKASKSIVSLESRSKKFDKAFKKISKASKNLKKEISSIDKEIGVLGGRRLQLQDQFKNGEISAQKLARKISLIDRKEQALNSKKLRLSNDLNKSSIEATKLERKLNSVQRRIRAINKLDKLSKGLTIGGTAALGVGAMTRGMSRAPVASFMELEDSQTMLEMSLMDSSGNVPKSFAEINRQAQELGNKLPGTTSDFYQIANSLKQLGISEESITGGVLKSSAYLAVVLKGQGVSYNEAAVATAKFKEAMGVEDGNMLKFIDLIQRTAHTGVKLQEMQYAFSKVGASMKGMGIKGYEAAKKMVPFIGMLIKGGFTGETVGTNLGGSMQKALTFHTSKAYRKIRKKYGIRFKFADSKGEFIGMEKMIGQLETKLKGLNSVQRQEILSQIFGTGESLNMIKFLLDKGVDGYKQYQAEMAKQADIDQRVQKSLSTLSATWEAFTGTMENIFAIIGKQVSPVLKKVTEKLNNMADSISKLSKEYPALTKWISYGIVGFSAFATALGVAGLAGGILAKGMKVFVSPVSKGIDLLRRLTGKSEKLSGSICGIDGCTSKANTGLSNLNGTVKKTRSLWAKGLVLGVSIAGVALVLSELNRISKAAKQRIDDKRTIAPTKANIPKMKAKQERLEKEIKLSKGEDGFWSQLGHTLIVGENSKAKTAQLEKLRKRSQLQQHRAETGWRAPTVTAPVSDPKKIAQAQAYSDWIISQSKPAPKQQPIYQPSGYTPPPPKQPQGNTLKATVETLKGQAAAQESQFETLLNQYSAVQQTVQTIASRPEQHTYHINLTVNNATGDQDVVGAVKKAMGEANYKKQQVSMHDL